MADETNTTGTPEQEGGDALAQTGTAGTPAPEGRDGESKEPDWKAMYLEAKGKIEGFNDLKAEVDQLKNSYAQSPAAPSVEPDDPYEMSAEDRANLEVAAASPGGWWAKEILRQQKAIQKQREEKENLVRDLVYAEQLREIPKDERQAVLEHWNKNRHRFGDPEAARADLQRQQYASELEKLRRENEALRKGPSPEVANAVPTYGRGVSAAEVKSREWTEDQFDREGERIRQQQGELAYLKHMASAPKQWKR